MKEKVKNTMTALGGIGLLISLLLLCPALAESEDKNPPVRVHTNPIPKPITPDDVIGRHLVDEKWYTMGDAVEAITKSDMWSDDMERSIEYISYPKVSMSCARYQAICKTAESDMWSHDKADSIGRICGY